LAQASARVRTSSKPVLPRVLRAMRVLSAKTALIAVAFASVRTAEALHITRQSQLNYANVSGDTDAFKVDPTRADVVAKLMATEMDIGGAQVRLHVPEHLREPFLKSPPKYVFGVSTGHVGSTTLSDSDSYTGSWKKHTVFRFEDFLMDSRGSHQRDAMRRWWDSKPSNSSQLKKTREYKDRVDHVMKEHGAKTFVDLGHHNLHGLLSSTPEVFGVDNVVLVRLRRARQETAFSLTLQVKDICDLWFRLCPTKDEVVLHPLNETWSHETWSKLSPQSQAYFFQDEVEAEYQRILREHSNVMHVECDWHLTIDPCLNAVASVLGLNANLHVHPMKVHHEDGDTADDHRKLLSEADAAYRKHMNYNQTTLKFIARTQF